MNASQMRSAHNRASIRKFLAKPIIALRLAMLKLALKDRNLEGISIEAIPKYWMGVPQVNQYHICIRTTCGIATLVADVVAEQLSYQDLHAYNLKVLRVSLPSHVIRMPWLRMDEGKPLP